MTPKEFRLYRISNFTTDILGYYVNSTARINVEDKAHTEQQNNKVPEKLLKIAEYLIKSQEPQVVISIHGYSNTFSAAKRRHRDIYNCAKSISKDRNCVFLGYRWSSQPPTLKYIVQSLPTLLIPILGIVLVTSIFSTVSLLFQNFYAGIIISFVTLLLLIIRGKALRLLPLLPFFPILLFGINLFYARFF